MLYADYLCIISLSSAGCKNCYQSVMNIVLVILLRLMLRNLYAFFSNVLSTNTVTTQLFGRMILCYLYQHQLMSLRWGCSISNVFNVTNGVRQGGILSPKLFNIYIDGLSNILNNSLIGGSLGGKGINYMLYADDLCIISLSSAGLQKLLSICDEYCACHSITVEHMDSSYTYYLTNQIDSNFAFRLIDNRYTLKIIKDIKMSMSNGHDGISSELLKLVNDDISSCITLINNQSLTTGIFPEN